MPSLVALALPPGPRFVAELSEAWADGDAVLPVDPRLPIPAARRLLEAMRPAVVVDEAGDRQHLRDGRPTEDGDAVVVATSGTTGEPKGVVLTTAALQASADATNRRLGVDPATDRWLSLLPVAHIGGLSVVTRALLTGTALTFDPDDPEATLTAVVPTQANRLDLRRFRRILVGGSADWRERDANVVRTYGMTETASGIAYDGLPLDGVEVRVDGAGQLRVRGPMLLRSYRTGDDPKDAEGWLPTGDSGSVGGDGRIEVDGRIGDVIVTGGEKVWPASVEDALRRCPGVADVAVAGRPDDEWGARVVAWVVPTPDGPAPSLPQLRERTKAHLPAYAAPRELRLVTELPRTALGKIQRDLLP